MYHPLAVTRPEDQARFCDLPGPSAPTPAVLARQRPDALWLLADGSSSAAGRCSLWWNQVPPLEGQRLGLIGHYAVTDGDASGPLLQQACAELTRHGCTLAVGPMDGNTWQRYRFLSERGPEPIFFLEPDNPDDWPGHFTAQGFTPLAEYYSALNTDLTHQDPRIPEIARRIETEGITLRPLRLDQFEEELRRVYDLSLLSFRQNFLYTPIGEGDFVAQYQGIRPYVRSDLVLIAELRGEPIGYVFAIPDLLQAKRGRPIDTVIVKTLAVHPDHGGAGLGGLLVARCQEAAARLGYTRAIHALMHETNKSRRISSHTARIMRRYTLYSRPLGEAQ
jgi:GNAT superfamily N-acetyltransferase